MFANTVFTIVFALLQGPTDPVTGSFAPTTTAGPIPVPPPVFGPAPPTTNVCPLNFCDDFIEVCESSGAPQQVCEPNAKICVSQPCTACDAVAASCNKAGGKHCDEIVDKCRSELVGCCTPTVSAECQSTEALKGFTSQFCIDHPFGRPAECSNGTPPSAKLCEQTIKHLDGCDVTVCEYEACAAALLTAGCNETPPECELIAACQG